MKKEEERTFV